MAKREYHFTGIGTLVYPFLNQPRAFKPREGEAQAEPAYDCRFDLTGEAAAELVRVFERALEERKQELKTNKVHGFCVMPEPAVDDEGSEMDGVTRFKFKVNAFWPAKDGEEPQPRRIFFVDTKGNPIANPPRLGSGTEARIKFQTYGWGLAKMGAGVTLQPVAVQIVKLVEYQADVARGFGEVDGGYEAPEPHDEVAKEDGGFDASTDEAAPEGAETGDF